MAALFCFPSAGAAAPRNSTLGPRANPLPLNLCYRGADGASCPATNDASSALGEVYDLFNLVSDSVEHTHKKPQTFTRKTKQREKEKKKKKAVLRNGEKLFSLPGPQHGPGQAHAAQAGSEQECSAKGPARLPVSCPRMATSPGSPAGPRHAHSSSSQSNRSVCLSASPRVTHGELRSCPSQPLSPPHPPSTGRGGHSSFKTDKVEETAGLNPKSKGKSRAPPSASSRFAGLRLPKGGKKKINPNTPTNPKTTQETNQGWVRQIRLSGERVIALRIPGREGTAGAELPAPSPPACPPEQPSPMGRCRPRHHEPGHGRLLATGH